jgi:hypothetical protein
MPLTWMPSRSSLVSERSESTNDNASLVTRASVPSTSPLSSHVAQSRNRSRPTS